MTRLRHRAFLLSPQRKTDLLMGEETKETKASHLDVVAGMFLLELGNKGVAKKAVHHQWRSVR